MKSDYFKDKVALVSGASRGVGFALAKQLVESGAKVVITARGEKRLLDSAAKLKDMGGSVAAVTGDVGKWEDAEKMVKAAIDNFGRLDILVNNAGVSMRGKFAELSPEVCWQVAETNLMGTIYLSRAAIPHIMQAKGSLVFISSIGACSACPWPAYIARARAVLGACANRSGWS
jgi:NAD(P)-dependent dehydrogenase (short-subunit alcohol dehydrogenase family)